MKKKSLVALLALTMAFSLGAMVTGCEDNNSSSSVTENNSSSQAETSSVSSEASILDDSSINNSSEEAESSSEEDGSVDTSSEEEVHTHAYTLVEEEAATYFETGVKAHYICSGCEDKFVKEGEAYISVTDEDLVAARKTIAEETTAATLDTTSSDLINTVVADKVKQFDQTQPTYVKINDVNGEETQAIYFSRTTAWDVTADAENNYGFVEFRIPVSANCGGVSFAYKLLDNNNDVCGSVSQEDKAYGMKSYIEYKVNGQYVNVSKDSIGNICFMADGEWNVFELECTEKNVEYIIIKIYHFEGELVVANMQTLTPKHIHETTEVPEQLETCTQDGNTAYYTCACGKFFADVDATEEIAENSWVLPAHHTMSETLEYNEEYHYYACEKCDYENQVIHTMQKVEDGLDCIGVERTVCECGYAVEMVVEDPIVDFTENAYGANVFSVEADTAYADRTIATASTLKYLLYHDNGVIQALHKISLPRIDFTKYGEVKLDVEFTSFQWDQQFGLTEDALTNASDTYVEAGNYQGKLTFTWKNESLQMKLRICGKTLVQTITDADIISGKASAYFYSQAYFDRYVTLSNFVFNTPDEVNPYGEQYIAGYATISGEQYDEAKRLVGLTVEIPAGLDWWVNAPVLTQSYLNALVSEKLSSVTIGVASTTTTNNFIIQYNGVPNYNANGGATVALVKDGGDLQFGYVDLNNGGKTVATTLTLTFTYSVDPQTFADEIGMTLASGVNMTKDEEGVYTLSNLNGYQKGAYFTAEQVNAWIAAGYDMLSLKVAFTAGDYIDQVVGYTTSLGFFTDESGSANWTINLKADEAIDFWVQKAGTVSSGAFTISEVQLQKAPSFTAGYATVSNEQYDAQQRIIGLTVEIPADLDWSKGGPLFTASYLNKLYAKGIRTIVIGVESTATENNFITYYNNVLDYDPRDGYTVTLLENGGDLKISYVNLGNNGATVATTLTLTIAYQLDPQTIAGEIGLTLASGVKIEKTAEGYTLSNMNGYQGGAYFSAEQVNAWIAQGYTSITLNISFTKGDDIDIVVGYTQATGFLTNGDSVFEWTLALNENQAIDLWAQKDGATSKGAFTITQVTLA